MPYSMTAGIQEQVFQEIETEVETETEIQIQMERDRYQAEAVWPYFKIHFILE